MEIVLIAWFDLGKQIIRIWKTYLTIYVQITSFHNVEKWKIQITF